MSKTSKDAPQYRALVGFNHPPGDRRVRAGAVISGLPDLITQALLDSGTIEPVGSTSAKTEEGEE